MCYLVLIVIYISTLNIISKSKTYKTHMYLNGSSEWLTATPQACPIKVNSAATHLNYFTIEAICVILYFWAAGEQSELVKTELH